jgi:hypothetical protein
MRAFNWNERMEFFGTAKCDGEFDGFVPRLGAYFDNPTLSERRGCRAGKAQLEFQAATLTWCRMESVVTNYVVTNY